MINEDFRYRLNGILVTVIIHMGLVVLFLFYKLGDVREKHEETMKVEIIEDETPLEDLITPTAEEIELLNFRNLILSEVDAKNIAVNVNEKLGDELSTEKYEEQLKQELGIKELNQRLDRTLPETDDPELQESKTETKSEEDKKPEQYKGKTTISYNLGDRWTRKQYVPVYRCEGGGIVIINIVVDSYGNVINAANSDKSNTKDECLIEEAINSAYKFLFNSVKNSEKEKGYISFQFIPQ